MTPEPHFATLILKLTAFCNLNCTYCYMFNLKDRTYSRVPKYMPVETAILAVASLAEHIRSADSLRMKLVLHGGEPSLWPMEPNAQAVQLELNPGLHLLGVATHGRGMWEIQTPAASAATITKVVSLTPDGIYGAGSRISIEVTFSEAVDVTGCPTLTLNSGGIAAYSSGSGSNALIFVYRVESGQSSPHLDYRSATALTLRGGTITGPGGEAAQLTLPVPGDAGSLGANSNLVIDAIAPEVVSYSVLFGAERFDLTTSSRNHLPWRVTGIQVIFSKPIALGDERSLAGIRTSGFNGLGTNTLTWNVGPLSDRDAATSLRAFGPHSLKDAAGNALNNGTDINRNFDVLYGDFDDDGIVGKSDIYGVRRVTNGPYNIFADINGDGVVDPTDVRIIRQRLGAE